MTVSAAKGLILAMGLTLGLTGCGMVDRIGPGRGTAALSETEQVAAAAYSIGDYEESARLYERAAERDPRSVEALLGLGRSYAALGQFSRAQNALTQARTRDRRNNDVLNELGNLALNRMHPQQAIGYYDEVLGRDRTNLAALTGKAVSLDFLSRHREAQEVYRQALSAYPTNFALLSNHALSQALSGQIGAGIAQMEELLRDADRGDTIRGNMAIAYALDGRSGDARAMLIGTMPEAEIAEHMRYLENLRRQHQSGRPVGYLIFN